MRWAGTIGRAVGVGALFLVCAAFGVLEVHSSTDTWIGLAGGREILHSPKFPTQDTFSFTVTGQVWLNQNWLTHAWQYWMYERFGPDSVIYGTWGMSASIFALVLLACYWRSGSWVAAGIAASLVGLGCRDFLSPRPATTGYFCFAAQWALLCALEGQGPRRRIWPIVLMLPVLMIWGAAHGSFIFGYAVLGLYVGHWFVVRTAHVRLHWLFAGVLPLIALLAMMMLRRPTGADAAAEWPAHIAKTFAVVGAYLVYWVYVAWRRPQPAVRGAQAAGLAGVTLLAVVLTGLIGPFGWSNFTHIFKIAESDIWRRVSEWTPVPSPLDPNFWHKLDVAFPPMQRFLWMLVAVLVLAAVLGTCQGLARLRARAQARGAADEARKTPASQGIAASAARPIFHLSVLDLAVIGIGLTMTLLARRFAPMFYIYAAPFMVAWIARVAADWPVGIRNLLRNSFAGGAALAAIALSVIVYQRTRVELVETFQRQPELGLLERVTRYDQNPHDAIQYMAKNELALNLFTTWTHAGPIMFYAPAAKMFIDGRAQQAYEEVHYQAYVTLYFNPETPLRNRQAILDGVGLPLVNGAPPRTDAILIWRSPSGQVLMKALEKLPQWRLVLGTRAYLLYLRQGSAPLLRAAELLAQGREWRPTDAYSLATRGNLWMSGPNPDPERALGCWLPMIERAPWVGELCFDEVVRAMLRLGRRDEARRFVERQRQIAQARRGNYPQDVQQGIDSALMRAAALLR